MIVNNLLIEKRELDKAIKMLPWTREKKNKTIYHNLMRLEASEKDGNCRLYAGSEDMHIKIEISDSIASGELDFFTDAKKTIDMIKNLPKGDQNIVSFEFSQEMDTETNEIKNTSTNFLTMGEHKIQFYVMPVSEHIPRLFKNQRPANYTANSLTVPANILLDAVNCGIIALPKNKHSVVKTHYVALHIKKDTVRVITSDGYRLAVAKIYHNETGVEDAKLLLPIKAALALQKILKTKRYKEVEIEWKHENAEKVHFIFDRGRVELTVNLEQKTLIAYEKITGEYEGSEKNNTQYNHSLTFNRQALQAALLSVSVKDCQNVDMFFSDKLRITSGDADRGIAEASLDYANVCNSSGDLIADEIELSFCIDYLIDVIKNLPGSIVKINYDIDKINGTHTINCPEMDTVDFNYYLMPIIKQKAA